MATINNMKGTSYQSFTVGKRGATIFQGTSLDTSYCKLGDIFINTSDSSLSQFDGTKLNKFILSSSNLEILSNLTLSTGYIKSDGTTITVGTVDGIKTDLGLKSAAYIDTGATAGLIPVLDSSGKLAASMIPSMALTDVSVVDSEDEKPSVANEGDMVIVTGTGKTYVCTVGSQTAPTWTELKVSSIITSVNSLTGDVVLTTDNITSSYTPTNYPVSGTSITSYLKGIDDKIGTISSGTSTLKSAAYVDTGTTSGTVPLIQSSGKLLSSLIPSINTVTTTNADTTTYPTSPNINDIIINTKLRISYVYDGTNWDIIQTQNIVSVNGLTGSTSSSTDGIITLNGTNINATYTPTNYTLAVDSSSNTIKTIDSYMSAIDTAIGSIKNNSVTSVSDTVNGKLNKIDTSTSSIEITSAGTEIVDILSTVTSGEKLSVTNSSGNVILSAVGTGDVNLQLLPDGNGYIQLGSGTEGSLTTDAGIPIDIAPGSSSTENGANLNLYGGNSTFSGSTGGSIILYAGSGMNSSGDIKLMPNFVPVSVDSITNKAYVDSKIPSTYISSLVSVDSNQSLIFSNVSNAVTLYSIKAGTNITLDSTTTNGTIIINGPDLSTYVTSTSLTSENYISGTYGATIATGSTGDKKVKGIYYQASTGKYMGVYDNDGTDTFLTFDDSDSSDQYLEVSGGTVTGNLEVQGSLTPSQMIIPNCTYANLPSSPTIGMMYLVTNGRKPGEAASSGTGAVAVYDGSIWMSLSSGTTVEI